MCELFDCGDTENSQAGTRLQNFCPLPEFKQVYIVLSTLRDEVKVEFNNFKISTHVLLDLWFQWMTVEFIFRQFNGLLSRHNVARVRSDFYIYKLIERRLLWHKSILDNLLRKSR